MNPLERDPNGLVAALVVVITAVAAAVGVTVDVDNVEVFAGAGAGLLDVVAVLVARRKTWAPDTVRALDATTVGEVGELPAVPDRG